MAEARANGNTLPAKLKDDLECAVCLQTCVHPAQLPCGHIFCFLCVKGIANQSKKCAMCRQEIPRDFIEQPTLLQSNLNAEQTKTFDEGYQWFYEGRNGWWQYDERTSKELEAAYKSGDKTSELLIAGFLYVVDLENMIQIRRNDPSRRRNIKRDLASIPKKGIAGLRTEVNEIENHSDYNSSTIHETRPENEVPITPSNTPQSPTSGRQSPETHDLMDRFQALHLDGAVLQGRGHSSIRDEDRFLQGDNGRPRSE
ncbi:hypothetical protein WA026_016378 [Henosepilachna vigintioctopunctata]|uniref:E3 ubiquitin-protein ligase n=1 Tax=Henosepilachna vigintioctopunctata TaxID=420089 RepID=A0AAW1UNF9_9CUCU